MKAVKTNRQCSVYWAAALLAILLMVFFWRSFLPDYVHFSNDGPLGQQNSAWLQLPGAMTGMWADIGALGGNCGTYTPSVSMFSKLLIGPEGIARFFTPIALFILGMGAWTFFRALKLSPQAAILGALAVMLNSTFFTSACWGVAAQQVALGMNCFALALVAANSSETPALVRYVRLALAGLCVGLNVIEGADIGAMFSLIVAAFVLLKALTETEGNWAVKTAHGVGRVLIVAVFAGFIAMQTVQALVGTSIQGVAPVAEDRESQARHWDWATQWSMPKKETLGLVVPGLFGYRMDTPKDIMPEFFDSYRGGNYWGGVGRDPGLDRHLDQGGDTPPPGGFMRFIGSGSYCGILVTLIAVWAVAQAFRRQNSPFTDTQKKFIWFWTALAAICLPLSWGRFAPFSHSNGDLLFYALLYKLPYFSSIRNPVKFLHFFSWALCILFAYGVHALLNRQPVSAKPAGKTNQRAGWWARAEKFDRRWTLACLGLLGVSVVGWWIFMKQQPAFILYLNKVGFSDDTSANEIASFSIRQVGWFIPLFAGAIGLLALAVAGCFPGPRAKLGGVLLGAFLIFDLGRADLPYVIHWDYKQKYEVGSLNPIVDFLRHQPYEHRVAELPFPTPGEFQLFGQLYKIEWMQHHFPYYNIQPLDLIQMPREQEDWSAYLSALQIVDQATYPRLTRKWELTNTRYLLGPAPFLDQLNSVFDPGKNRFRIVERFEVVPKPGILQPTRLEEMTAVSNANGPYALFEFTGALPRATVYSNWQVNTNNTEVLKTLADLKFDPAKTVLVDTPQKNLPAVAVNENSGTVEYKSYSPRNFVLQTEAATPTVLLVNDRYDPNWHVTVDGQPADLLRCNFIMRGVYLAPGRHTVEFSFSLPHKPLYVTLSAFGVGLVLCGVLWAATRRKN